MSLKRRLKQLWCALGDHRGIRKIGVDQIAGQLYECKACGARFHLWESIEIGWRGIKVRKF